MIRIIGKGKEKGEDLNSFVTVSSFKMEKDEFVRQYQKICDIPPLFESIAGFYGLGRAAGSVSGQTLIESPPTPAAEDHFMPALLALRTGKDAAAVSSGVVMIRVTVKKIGQVDDVDFAFDQADFWTNVRIKSASRDTTLGSPAWENQDVVTPDWTVVSAAKKGETIYFSISVYDREWPSGNTDVDVNPGGGRAFTINLPAEPGKTYAYTKEGDEAPRGKIELVITMEDLFVQLAKDGQSLIRTFADIANEYAPGGSDGAWLKSPWGNWAIAMRASFSDRTEAAMIQLTCSVAASGLLSPIAAYGSVAIQKQVIDFIFKEYVKYIAKEYLNRKRPDHEYLGAYDTHKKALLYATYRLYNNLNELNGLYDTEIKSYDNEDKLALALNNEINTLTEAVKNAKEVVYHLDVITSNTKELTELGGIRYKPSETGMYSDRLFTAMYLSLKNELLLKENLLKWFGPDIQISQLTCNPAIPAQGQPATLNFIVTNNGVSQAAVAGYTAYEVFIDGKSVGKRSGTARNPLKRNESWAASFEYTFSSTGSHTVMVMADPDNKVPEMNEKNNEKSLTISVATPPDLRVKNPWTDNNACTFTDGKSAHHIVLKVNPEKKVHEILDANNEKATDIRMAIETVVVPATQLLPDIRVASMTISPGTPKQREAATLTVVVENAGKLACADDRYGSYKLYNNGGLVAGHPAGSGAGPLAAGKQWITTIPCVFNSAGPNTVRIEMDPENKVKEMDETNNTFIITVKVIERPVVPGSIN